MIGVGGWCGRCVAIAANCSAETGQALEGLGHVGTRGNEIADELARKDAEKASVGPEPIMRIYEGKDNVFQKHFHRWRELSDRQSQRIIAGIQDAPDGCLTLTVRLVVGLGKTLFGGISL